MLNNDLIQEIKKTREEYNLILNNIEVMHQNPIIRNYLEEQEKLKKIESYQKYLEHCEIGEDGTIFESRNNSISKSYGLSYAFDCALSLKYYGSDQAPNTGISMTYTEFLLYLKKVQSILSDNKKYEGDYRINNPYGLEIYQNPNNIKVLRKEEEIFIEILKSHHNHYLLAKALEDYNINQSVLLKSNTTLDTSFFLVLPRNIRNLELLDIEKLTEREQVAFFGEESQKILGVKINIQEIPNKESKKAYTKK